jgi:CDP-diglyceride synthetase
VEVVWVFLPLLGAFIAHAPVLRFGLFPGLARPIDGGATFRGRRIFGDNKTWRGAIVMTSGVVAAACLLAQAPAYWSRLPEGIQHAGPWVFGLLLGLGAVVGELPNSFLKRQLDIGAGHRDEQVAHPFGPS